MRNIIWLILVSISTASFAVDKSLGYFERVQRTTSINYKSVIDACQKTYKDGFCSISVNVKKDEKIQNIGSVLNELSKWQESEFYVVTLSSQAKGAQINFKSLNFDEPGRFNTPKFDSIAPLLAELIKKPISFVLEKSYTPPPSDDFPKHWGPE